MTPPPDSNTGGLQHCYTGVSHDVRGAAGLRDFGTDPQEGGLRHGKF